MGNRALAHEYYDYNNNRDQHDNNDECCSSDNYGDYDVNNNKVVVNNSVQKSKSIEIMHKNKRANDDDDKKYSSSWSPDTRSYSTITMNIVTRWAKKVQDYYKEINPATLNGAIDVVVVRQEDGTFKSSPFHVRFGKMGVIRAKEKIVDIEINDQQVDDLHMMLGDAGEAFFIESDNESEDSDHEVNDDDDDGSRENMPPKLPPIRRPSDDTTHSEPSDSPTTKDAPHSFELNGVIISDLNETVGKNSNFLIANSNSSTNLNESFSSNSSSVSNVNTSNSNPIMATTAASTINPSQSVVTSNWLKTSNDMGTGGSGCFSDGEWTPELTSPVVSRPPTPKSDTEVEILNGKSESEKRRMSQHGEIVSQYYWNWGQLPERANTTTSDEIKKPTDTTTSTVPTSTITTTDKKKEDEKKNLLSNIYGTFMGKKASDATVEGGIYLDDTYKLDSEVAALYINQNNSIRPIPHAAISQSSQQIQKDEDQDSGSSNSLPQSPTKDIAPPFGDIQISLCGVQSDTMNQQVYEDLFQQHSISYDRFLEQIATITVNPNLIIKINNRYLNWQAAAPILLCVNAFHRQPPNELVNQIVDANMPKPRKTISQTTTTAATTTTTPAVSTTTITTATTTSTNQPTTVTSNVNAGSSKSWFFFGKKQPTPTTTTASLNGSGSTLVETVSSETVQNQLTTIQESTDAAAPTAQVLKPKVTKKHSNEKKERYRRTTRLSSELISKLNLQPGANKITYSVTTAIQGTTSIDSYIFLWDHGDKIIVSDIDGTVTKSDVLGHVFTIFGKDWTHAGIADLFSAIESNSYKFMYLSARAIGQSKVTRDLLRSINQDGYRLPEGPLLVTPSSLFTAFHKEVIEKRPQDFKISCLEDIKSLFPKDRNPFYAGYGNRATDCLAYRAVGIPSSRIFTINPKGELKHEVSQTFQLSYSKLCDYVEQIFPPVKSQHTVHNEYSAFNYWKDPLPQIQIDDPIVEPSTLNDNKKDKNNTKTKQQLRKNSAKTISTNAKPIVQTQKSSSSSSINTLQQQDSDDEDVQNNNFRLKSTLSSTTLTNADSIEQLSKSL